jgi:hypothetical protein
VRKDVHVTDNGQELLPLARRLQRAIVTFQFAMSSTRHSTISPRYVTRSHAAMHGRRFRVNSFGGDFTSGHDSDGSSVHSTGGRPAGSSGKRKYMAVCDVDVDVDIRGKRQCLEASVTVSNDDDSEAEFESSSPAYPPATPPSHDDSEAEFESSSPAYPPVTPPSDQDSEDALGSSSATYSAASEYDMYPAGDVSVLKSLYERLEKLKTKSWLSAHRGMQQPTSSGFMEDLQMAMNAVLHQRRPQMTDGERDWFSRCVHMARDAAMERIMETLELLPPPMPQRYPSRSRRM